MKKGKKRGDKRKKWLRMTVYTLALTLVFFCIITLYLLKGIMEPNLEDITRIRAEVVVSRTINKALAEQFIEDNDERRFFTVQRDKDGVMEMVTADSVAINGLMAELSLNIQKEFKAMETESMEIPAGALLGSKVLSHTGPGITVNIIPTSITSMDFRTEFEEQGINQTKYKVYIVLGCKIKILCPFASETIESSNTVLVAEAVILGKVPNSYVEVPEEDILDVTEQ